MTNAVFAAVAGPDHGDLFVGSNLGGKPTVVITAEGEIHRLVNDFSNYEKIGMLDALSIEGVYYNLWDVFEHLPGSIQKGRFLHIDVKYSKLIANWLTSKDLHRSDFKDYADLSLKEFLDQMCDEETRTFMQEHFRAE